MEPVTRKQKVKKLKFKRPWKGIYLTTLVRAIWSPGQRSITASCKQWKAYRTCLYEQVKKHMFSVGHFFTNTPTVKNKQKKK